MSAGEMDGDTEVGLFRAQRLLETHRPREALQALAGVLAQDPHDVDALCLAAQAELARKQPDRARELAATAVAQAPDAEWPLRLLALSLERMGRHTEAYDAARGAVALAPNLWQTHHTLAEISSDMPGLGLVARAAAQRAIELAPLEADTHAILGRVAVDSGDQAAAERALREALRLDPQNAVARNDLGRLQLLRKDHLGAAGHFAQAAASDVRIGVAEHNIDVALASAVARIMFWVWIVMLIPGRLALDSPGDAAVGFGIITLAALVGLLVWQLFGVVPALRGRFGPYLRLLPHRDRSMTAMIGLLVFGMLVLMVMCVLPPDWRLAPFAVGVGAVIGSRILLELRSRKLKKAG